MTPRLPLYLRLLTAAGAGAAAVAARTAALGAGFGSDGVAPSDSDMAAGVHFKWHDHWYGFRGYGVRLHLQPAQILYI